MNKWLLGLLIVVMIPLALILLFPVIAGGHPPRRSQEFSNMKQLSLACIMYANDQNERLPLAVNWLDQVAVYLKIPEAVRCAHLPDFEGKEVYGHVLEESMPSRNLLQIKDSTTVPMLFDGKDLSRNTVASLLDVRVTRIEGNLIFTVAFADGHVKARKVPVFDQ